jgi:hypothetical protein
MTEVPPRREGFSAPASVGISGASSGRRALLSLPIGAGAEDLEKNMILWSRGIAATTVVLIALNYLGARMKIKLSVRIVVMSIFAATMCLILRGGA